jgi:hypothetical protein
LPFIQSGYMYCTEDLIRASSAGAPWRVCETQSRGAPFGAALRAR